jgi:LacI family transcriptional regulator
LTPYKPVRLVDIAREAEVSATAVGYVLQGSGGKNIRVNPDTAKRIREIAHRMNYSPNLAAQQLAGKKSMTIGVLMDPKPLKINSVRLAEIGKRAKELGYHIVIMHEYPNVDSVTEAINEFTSRGIDGLICMHHIYPELDISIAELVAKRIKNVVFIDPPSVFDAAYVGFDFERSAVQLVKYLKDKGRSRIGFACINLNWLTGINLYNGYLKAVKQYGLPLNEDLIWMGSDHGLLDDTQEIPPENADEIIQQLVVRQKADAIVALNDYCGVQLVNSLRDKGFDVPGDVSVAGGGNYDVSRYCLPRLTTTDQMFGEVAHKAVNMLVDIIEGKENAEKGVLLTGRIIERESA